MNLKQYFAILIAAQLSLCVAASPVIGVASARGEVRVNNLSAVGNGTLFEGTTVETTRTASDVRLNTGVRMQLASGSKGTVFSDHAVLDRGESQLQIGGTPYRVDARSLRVFAEQSGTVGRVQIAANDRVLVAALHGNLRVSTANGITIASLAAGRSLEFDVSKAGASGPSKMSGCLERVNGKLMLTDETTGVTVELRGSGVDKHVGNKVEITGTHVPAAMNPSSDTQTVQVTAAKEISKRCTSAAGAPAAAAGASTASAASGTGAAGTSTGAAVGAGVATKAVIAGVVVAAAATGAAIAVTGKDNSLSR